MNEWQYFDRVKEAAGFLESKIHGKVDLVFFTGTGLSDILNGLETVVRIAYSDIPHMPTTSVSSHLGSVRNIQYKGLQILIFQGRFHYYEGFNMSEITFPIRILQLMGVKEVVFINAAGGLRSDMKLGDVIPISDHIYHLPENPLRGLKMKEWGNRFPDPKRAYDIIWLKQILDIIENENEVIKSGTYVCLSGPNLETTAEVAFWKKNNVDLIGMSTLPEVLVALQADMRIMALSMVTNTLHEKNLDIVTLEDVVNAGQNGLPYLDKLLMKWLGVHRD